MVPAAQKRRDPARRSGERRASPGRRLALLVVGFALAGAVGYSLPRGEVASDPLALISALFTAYGLIWLPAVSIVLGARAFSRQARAMNL